MIWFYVFIVMWLGLSKHLMFEIIVKTWDCLGENSGQIQIVIGLIAFWLAYEGYKKVIDQIKISLEQQKESKEQRNYGFKIEILNLLFKTLDNLNTHFKLLFELRNAVESSIEEATSQDEKDHGNQILQTLDSNIKSTQENIETILELTKKINENPNFDISKDSHVISKFYNVLIKSNATLIRVEMLKAEFLEPD